ncbi:MAG: hypothetical protein IT423_22030 [Pirellulaceae bacterium]|nr:hypothetical protein [Pirellulaceae bacterium]
MITWMWERQNWRSIGLPLLGLGLAYYTLLDLPLSHQITEQLAKRAKLIEQAERGQATHTVAATQLSAVTRELRELTDELDLAKKRGARLVTERADLRTELRGTQSPASQLSATLELLSRHGLQCLESAPAAMAPRAGSNTHTSNSNANKPPAIYPESIQSLVEPAGQDADHNGPRRAVRVTLRGRFEDVRNAINEMQAELACVYIVSLEMETSDDHEGSPTWILTILV